MMERTMADKVIQRQDKDGMLRRALERIIQLYTDKSHFVYELLQNAEDAGATQIKFIQHEDCLEVLHDGRPFSLDNLQGLCDIGKSDKISDLNQIGEFGVGFKSVFGICETVRLYSHPIKIDEVMNMNLLLWRSVILLIRRQYRMKKLAMDIQQDLYFHTKWVLPFLVLSLLKA